MGGFTMSGQIAVWWSNYGWILLALVSACVLAVLTLFDVDLFSPQRKRRGEEGYENEKEAELIGFTFSILLVLVYVLITGEYKDVQPVFFHVGALLSGIFGAIAYIFYFKALYVKEASAGLAAATWNSSTVFVFVLEIAVFNYLPTPLRGVGAVLLVAGGWLYWITQKEEKKKNPVGLLFLASLSLSFAIVMMRTNGFGEGLEEESALVWYNVGQFLVGLFVYSFDMSKQERRKLRRFKLNNSKSLKFFSLLFFLELLQTVGDSLRNAALLESQGHGTLVAAILATETGFVILFSAVLVVMGFASAADSVASDAKSLVGKIIAFLVIVVGAAVISY
jgi:uncharacterized membrane protein